MRRCPGPRRTRCSPRLGRPPRPHPRRVPSPAAVPRAQGRRRAAECASASSAQPSRRRQAAASTMASWSASPTGPSAGCGRHPRTQLLYALLTALCFAVTRSLMLTCLVPAVLLALRYYYSRKVILAYLECALHTDMPDIEQYYMKPPGSCFWVAVLGRKVLEFAVLHDYSAVVLGTTAVKVTAHKLYESLGFRHMGASDHYVLPGMTLSLAERLFFEVRYHRYRLQLQEE
ncbi:N-acetylaspartate synthetase [Sciurus carolinensis]|uniref:N-acetylaspartate synthetase n=1 Tax=Sciurus carolinensis TaxID=30640 RepID=A0AA41SV64_SCICA|nr:N-acetylaspartate synthetase [Sciurus carolinensis]